MPNPIPLEQPIMMAIELKFHSIKYIMNSNPKYLPVINISILLEVYTKLKSKYKNVKDIELILNSIKMKTVKKLLSSN